MLSKDQRDEVEKSLEKALVLEKPVFRLCTDLDFTIDQELYREIEEGALKRFDDAAFMIGEYEEKLKPSVKDYIENKNFSYSLIDVDGVKKSGHINTSLWLVKKDLEKDDVDSFDSVLHYITEIIVGERIENLEEVRSIFDEDAFAKVEILTKGYELGKPPLLKISYKYTAPGRIEYEKGIITGVPHPYLSLSPAVWHFYGEKSAPPELQNLEKEIRRNPHRFLKIE